MNDTLPSVGVISALTLMSLSAKSEKVESVVQVILLEIVMLPSPGLPWLVCAPKLQADPDVQIETSPYARAVEIVEAAMLVPVPSPITRF